jgi:predicted DNA-binding protein
MASTTVRISREARESLRKLSEQTGRKLQDLLDEAVERYRRELFLQEANAAFAALRADKEAWAEEEEERAVWEGTLADGLEE